MLPKRLLNKLIDIDANLLHPDLINKLAYHVNNATSNKYHIAMFIVPGSTIEDTLKSLELTKLNPSLYRSTIGIHPYNTESIVYNTENQILLENIIKTNSNNFNICIGECGLDYSEGFPNKECQINWFKFQLNLAKKYNRYLYLHIRNAHTDFLSLLQEVSQSATETHWNSCDSIESDVVDIKSIDIDAHTNDTITNAILSTENNDVTTTNHWISTPTSTPHHFQGVIHCFTGTYEELCVYVDLGFYIGITGYIFNFTPNPNAHANGIKTEGSTGDISELNTDIETARQLELKKWFDKITLNKLVIETDAPYMGFKGCRDSENDDHSGSKIKASVRKRNSTQKYPNLPCSLVQIVKYISEITSWPVSEITTSTTVNAMHLFDIKE